MRHVHRMLAGSGRKLAASLLAVFAAISAVIVPATAAHADGQLVVHYCLRLGNADSKGISAIICDDIAVQDVSGNGTVKQAFMQAEAYCQYENSGGYVQCSDTHIYGGFYIAESDKSKPQWLQSCGPSPLLACSVPRQYYQGDRYFQVSNGACLEVIAVIWGDATDNYQSSIDLQTGRKKLGANLSEHYKMCATVIT